MHQTLAALQTRHFGVYSPIKVAADLGFNLGILRLFHPGRETESIAAQIEALTRRINGDQLDVVRTAAHLAATGRDVSLAADLLARETAATDLAFYRELLRLQRRMEAVAAQACRQPASLVRSYYRGGMVASALVAGLLGMGADHGVAQSPRSADVDRPAIEDTSATVATVRLSDEQRGRVHRLIAQLDSDAFALREAATKALSALAAEEAARAFPEIHTEAGQLLEDAAHDGAPETSLRAREVLRQMRSAWAAELLTKSPDERDAALKALSRSPTSIRAWITQVVEACYADGKVSQDHQQVIQQLSRAAQQRFEADAQQLRAIVKEAVPKLKITTSLVLKVDPGGRVVAVAAHDGDLPAEVEQAVIRLLAKRGFQLHEITGRVRLPREPEGKIEPFDYRDPIQQVESQRPRPLRPRLGPLD